MTRIVVVFGLISGAIIAALMWLMLLLMRSGGISSDHGEVWGYTTMIIALSMIFFGIRSYRANHGGTITFFKGLQIGILISIIASVCYGISWEIYYQTLGGSFMTEYIAHTVEKMQAAGKAQAEIDAVRKQMDELAAMYTNFFYRFGLTIMEILPVGVIVTFVSAALLRKREILPADAA